jgi:hypothetical protein
MNGRFLLAAALLFVVCTSLTLRAQAADLQLAMIGPGPDSFAAKLHYPPKEKAAKTEAAVQFYCEITAAGQARHSRVVAGKQWYPFGEIVEKALHTGRFNPARAGGKPVPVILGGSVLFLARTGQPTILVSLTTAEKEKAGSGQNYVQPQMLSSYADLERKCFTLVRSMTSVDTPDPAAEVAMSVDENGKVTSAKQITGGKAGWGTMLLKAVENSTFIPAQANGRPVAGQFNLVVDVRMMTDPDQPSSSASHLRPREQP